ncbi:protein phosphatase 1 regulatory subunit 3B isoform X1 [Musca domestica]|uniref:Protein phosphatase 1 regulatory subunit 3B isoform X1 n=2 Tax=Musca domestica TaxID=7370 RepID=A0ABM3VH58_MUSDO|nr:protein phosphatase 1 regulatory subunit 3B isoform X1 [Musca domestica]
MISHSPPIFSHSPPVSFLADFMNNRQSLNCNDEHNRASRYCRPPVITLASKAMVNNAQQRVASPNFGGTSSNDNNRLNSTSNSNTNNSNAQYKANITSFMPEMGRRLERMTSAPTLPMTPKSCLRRKSCLHKSSTESIEVTDKDTNTDTKCSENNGHQRKKVIFADDEGLSLTQIRVMSEPSNVPPYWSMKFLEQITQGLVTPHPADQWTVDFKQPASDYLVFRQTIERDFVSLENVIVKDEESIVVGTVKVKNISFAKEVVVRVTWDDWKSQQDIFCTYNRAYGPATCAHVVFDTFSFKITLPPSSKRLEFCICYRADGQEYWDNNGGKNYTITKRSPFYYNALSPYEKNNTSSAMRNSASCQSQVRSALSAALANKNSDSTQNWQQEPSPYW